MRARSVVLLTFASVFVAAVAGLAWMYGGRAEVQARLDAFLAEQARRDAATVRTRDALYRDTLDGEAFEHYAAADRTLKEQELASGATDGRTVLLQRAQPLSPAAHELVGPCLAAALSSIRSGVRCSRRGQDRAMDGTLLEWVVDDATERAFAAGETGRGAELFVDRCVFAIDVGYGEPELPAFRDEWLARLDAGAGTLLAAALGRLDERWPRSASAERWIALSIRNELQHGHLRGLAPNSLDAYEYGFDAGWRHLVLCDELLARVPALSPPAEPWPQRQAQYAAFGAGAVDPPRAFADRLPRLMSEFERHNREQLTRLRFLRLAVAFTCRGELPQLDDPLGSGRIEVVVDGDDATFRSAGMCENKRLERRVRRR